MQGSIITDPLSVAKEFYKCYSYLPLLHIKGESLQTEQRMEEGNLVFGEVTLDEILKMIYELNNKKSSGWVDLSIFVIKQNQRDSNP